MPTKKKPKDTKTAIDAQRTSADYVIYPEDLYVETNPKHPLYDPRFALEVTAEQIETWAIAGQTKDIVCRKNGARIEVIDGLQTWKTAVAVNKNRKAHGAPLIQVRITLKPMSDSELLLFRGIANKHRRSLPSMVAHQVANMVREGLPRESIVLAVDGIESERDLDRHLAFHQLAREVKDAVDQGEVKMSYAVRELGRLRLDEQPAAVARLLVEGRPTAPKTGERARPFPAIDDVRRVHARSGTAEHMHPQAQAVLGWVAGKVTQDELLAVHPALAPAFA